MKPKFKVGQLVKDSYAGFHVIARIDADGTLYEDCGNYITKISNVIALSDSEIGPRKSKRSRKGKSR